MSTLTIVASENVTASDLTDFTETPDYTFTQHIGEADGDGGGVTASALYLFNLPEGLDPGRIISAQFHLMADAKLSTAQFVSEPIVGRNGSFTSSANRLTSDGSTPWPVPETWIGSPVSGTLRFMSYDMDQFGLPSFEVWVDCTADAIEAATNLGGVLRFMVQCINGSPPPVLYAFYTKDIKGEIGYKPILTIELEDLPSDWTLIASDAASGTDKEVTLGPLDTTGADLLTVYVSVTTLFTEDGTFIDSEDNTWVEEDPQNASVNKIRTFYCIDPATSPTHTFTFTGADDQIVYPAMGVYAHSHALGSCQFIDANGADDDQATISGGSVTATTDDCLVLLGISFWPQVGNAVTGVDNEFDIDEQVAFADNINVGLALASLTKETSATFNAIATFNGAMLACATTLVFQGAEPEPEPEPEGGLPDNSGSLSLDMSL